MAWDAAWDETGESVIRGVGHDIRRTLNNAGVFWWEQKGSGVDGFGQTLEDTDLPASGSLSRVSLYEFGIVWG